MIIEKPSFKTVLRDDLLMLESILNQAKLARRLNNIVTFDDALETFYYTANKLLSFFYFLTRQSLISGGMVLQDNERTYARQIVDNVQYFYEREPSTRGYEKIALLNQTCFTIENCVKHYFDVITS